MLLFLSGLPVWLFSKDKSLWGWWLTAQHFLWLTLCHLGQLLLNCIFLLLMTAFLAAHVSDFTITSFSSELYFFMLFFCLFGRSCLPPHGLDSLSVSTIPCRAWCPSPPQSLAVGLHARREVQPGPLPSLAAAAPFTSCPAHSSTVTLTRWQCSWWHHTGAGAQGLANTSAVQNKR